MSPEGDIIKEFQQYFMKTPLTDLSVLEQPSLRPASAPLFRRDLPNL